MTLQNDLNHFSGTEQYYKLSFTPLLSTDGVKYFADTGQAYWLIGDISAIHLLKRRKYDFIAVTVKSSGGDVIAKYTDGNKYQFFKQEYTHSDLPDGEYKFFICNDVLMLASEY